MTPDEAYHSPYEYAVREQFFREAESLLRAVHRILHAGSFRFTIDDRTASKAIWMLHVDANESLREITDALREGNHRVAAKVFRCALEALDIAAYFSTESRTSERELAKWYEGGIVTHGLWRKHLRERGSSDISDSSKAVHQQLSRHIHSAYPSLLLSYIAGGADKRYLVHDTYQATISERGDEARRFLVHPQIVAMHCSTLAALIMHAVKELVAQRICSAADALALVRRSMESDTVPRRFVLPTRAINED